MLDKSPDTTVSILLDRVGGELDHLTVLLSELQESLGPILRSAADTDPAGYRHAQNLDLVWQTVESLAYVIRAVAKDGASACPIDLGSVTADVRLADLAARLLGHPDSDHTGGDDLDLF